MIKANLFQDPHNGSVHLTLYGHANTGEKGRDLLCCAVTTLAYTAAQAMSYFFELGWLARRPRLLVEEGAAEIIATPLRRYRGEVLQSFWTIQCGLQILCKNYPENIELETMRLPECKTQTAEC